MHDIGGVGIGAVNRKAVGVQGDAGSEIGCCRAQIRGIENRHGSGFEKSADSGHGTWLDDYRLRRKAQSRDRFGCAGTDVCAGLDFVSRRCRSCIAFPRRIPVIVASRSIGFRRGADGKAGGNNAGNGACDVGYVDERQGAVASLRTGSPNASGGAGRFDLDVVGLETDSGDILRAAGAAVSVDNKIRS